MACSVRIFRGGKSRISQRGPHGHHCCLPLRATQSAPHARVGWRTQQSVRKRGGCSNKPRHLLLTPSSEEVVPNV
jgi:hypothetical protein